MRDRARVDARALAALRIALGTLLLGDLLLRARSLAAFYTDAGVVPRHVLAELYPLHPSLSIHALSGDAWFQAVLFVSAGIAALALLVGYRTRLATVVSLVLLVSLHARNPTVLNSGDVLLRRLLFFSLFLPLGARWSIDAGFGDEQRSSVANVASLALLLQVVLVYATNAWFKLDSQLWLDGEAVGYVLALDRFSVLFGPLVSEVEVLVVALDWIWLALLFASPLLLVTTGRRRAVLAAAFVAAHVGMTLTMDLAIFPFVSIASLLPFLPASVWDRTPQVRDPDRWGWSGGRVARGVPGSSGSIISPGSLTVSRSLTGRIARYRPAVHALVLVVLLVASGMGVGPLPAPDGTPEQMTGSSWTMFASPPTHDTWIVAEGTFASRRTTDLVRERSVRLDRPPDTDRFPNARWRKHRSRYDGSSPLPRAYAVTQCGQSVHSAADLRTIRLVRIWKSVDEDDDVLTRELGRYRCTETGVVPITDGAER